MNGWSPNDQVVDATKVITGIVTDQAISKEFPISAGGALNFVAKIEVANVAHTGTQTLKLQTAIGSDWVDSKTAVVTANGKFYIKLLSTLDADKTYLPLLSRGRIVLSQTHANDAMSITAVNILTEL
jgi:hypothetical protein